MYKILPLFSDSTYTYTTSILDLNFRFDFYWNSRQQMYHFDVYNEDNTPFRLGTPLVVDSYPIVWDDKGSTLMCIPAVESAMDTIPTQIQTPDYYRLVFFQRE